MSLAYPLLKKKPYTEELYQSEDGLTSFKNYLLHTGKGILSILFCSVLFSYFCVPFSLSLKKKRASICSLSFFTLEQALGQASRQTVQTVL